MAVRNSYRKMSFITDVRGIKSAIGEANGIGFPKQPKLSRDYRPGPADPVLDEKWFIDTIKDKVANHPLNAMEFPFTGERIFEEPMVDFIAGDDPIFVKYKEMIGPQHLLPQEWIAWQAAQNRVAPPPAPDISVVSWVMPLSERTKRDNAAQKEWPAERWAQTRLLGEIYQQAMVREIVTSLMGRGVLAIAPDQTSFMRKKRYPGVGWASPWSHRHMAFAAGLGSFGMHDFFITEKGAAHRCGSLIVNLRLKQSRQRQDSIHANCLHHNGVKCLKCAGRCPVGAIDERGHDKEACYQHVVKSLPYCNKHYHIFIYGCGICSVGTPCESVNPVLKLKETGKVPG